MFEIDLAKDVAVTGGDGQTDGGAEKYKNLGFVYGLKKDLVNHIWSWQVKVFFPTPRSKVLELPKEEKYIFPGTKWCGPGDIAKNYDDLGRLNVTDSCCREHDYCSDSIAVGQSAHGLTNDASYTRLNCECDKKLWDCLLADGSESSKIIAFIYFNMLNTQCFKEDHPIVKCEVFYKLSKKCKVYKLDSALPKVYQYFDVPLFISQRWGEKNHWIHFNY